MLPGYQCACPDSVIHHLIRRDAGIQLVEHEQIQQPIFERTDFGSGQDTNETHLAALAPRAIGLAAGFGVQTL